MKGKPTPEELLTAMHSKCLDCCCGQRKAVQQCKSRDCALWKYRNEQARERVKPIRGQLTLFELAEAVPKEGAVC